MRRCCRTCVLALLVVVLCQFGCGARQDPEMSDVSLFESSYLSALLEFQPYLAVRQGISQYEGRAVTLTPLIVARRIDDLKLDLGQVVALRQRELTPEEAMRARLIDYRIRAEILDLESIETWRHDPTGYLRIPFESITYLLNDAAGSSSERLRSIQIHLHELEGMMANMRGNLDQTPEAAVLRSLDLGRRIEQMLDSELPEWGEQAAGVDVRLRDSFTLALDRAVRSLNIGLPWLENTVTRVDDSQAALGPERFVMKLLFEEMFAIPLEELSELAEQSVETDQSAFLEQARRMDPNRSPRQLLWSAGAAPVSSEEVATQLRRYAEQARAFAVDRGLVPAAAYPQTAVDEAPDYLREPLTTVWLESTEPDPAELEQESPDQELVTVVPSPRVYYAPPPDGAPEELRAALSSQLEGPALMLSAAREAIPGRYLMEYYAASTPNSIQQMLVSRSAQDGWASYAEQLLVDEGFGAEDPAVLLVHLWRNLISDCRLLATIRLHTGGASLDDAVALFVDRAYVPEEWARLEARRALLDPSGAAETLAKREIIEIREQYRPMRGGSFRLDEFHADYLALGPIPVPLARERLLKPE